MTIIGVAKSVWGYRKEIVSGAFNNVFIKHFYLGRLISEEDLVNGKMRDIPKKMFFTLSHGVIDYMIREAISLRDRELKFITTPPIEDISTTIDKMKKAKFSLSQSIFLYGDPGVGKTFVVSALLSKYKNFSLKTITADSIVDKDFKGNKKKYHEEDEYTPSSVGDGNTIVLIDEIDRGLTEDNVTVFLKNIDLLRRQSLNANTIRHTIIIMTSNKHPSELPKALMRPGRVSKITEVKPWTKKEAKDFADTFEIPFERLTCASNGSYYAGQCFEDAQEYVMSQL